MVYNFRKMYEQDADLNQSQYSLEAGSQSSLAVLSSDNHFLKRSHNCTIVLWLYILELSDYQIQIRWEYCNSTLTHTNKISYGI